MRIPVKKLNHRGRRGRIGKREAIARRAKKAMADVRKGRVRKGTLKDLYKDLES